MEQKFDAFNYPELPTIILTNPNRDEICSLALSYNTKLVTRFNAMSDFTFTYPKSIDGGETFLEGYNLLQNKRLVHISGYGYFIITDSEEDNQGDTPIKNITCKSQESELIQKTLAAYGKTTKLYDIFDPTGTILQDMINLAPSWSVGTIDIELLTKFRTFNISSSNVYNFLMNDVETAFECVFTFDTETKTINATTIDNATKTTDIFLSFDNVIKKSTFSEKSDEVTTDLVCYGGGTLDISLVNPMGNNHIYNFDYYTNTTWMSQGLVTAITNWKILLQSKQVPYSADLLLLETYNGELLVLQSTLATYTEEYLALQGVQKARIQANQTYADINTLLIAKQTQINAQNVLITNKKLQITNITAQLQTIHNQVSFTTNFTTLQLKELDNFIYQNTYKNENIIVTDQMTLVEIQHQSQALYDQSKNVLARVSQPRYEIGLEAINYIALKEFEVFTIQTELGSKVTAEIEDGVFVETILLELSQNFTNPTDFSMTFSNRVRLDGANYTYSDLMGQVQKTGGSVTFDSLKWANWENNYKNSVTTFITSALDTTTNNLISNSNQEILINQNGLRARQSTGGGNYSLKQAWLVNNVLAFSNDGFTTSKLALGEISLPAGGTAYGIVGDVIIGKILAGNTLTITNDHNNFVLDETGATLTNAKFTLSTTNTKLILDPTSTQVVRIQKNIGGTFTNQFWVDNTGNVNFSGTLSGANGSFTGSISANSGNIGTLVIDSQGLKTSNGVNYLRGNGDLKWGALSITGSTAVFQGDIYANKIVGQIIDPQIASGLGASKVTYGSMLGNRIAGGAINDASLNFNSGSVSVFSVGGGQGVIKGNSSIRLEGGSGGATLVVAGSGTSIGGGTLFLGALSAIDTGSGHGVTGDFNTGSLTFAFRHGICYDVF